MISAASLAMSYLILLLCVLVWEVSLAYVTPPSFVRASLSRNGILSSLRLSTSDFKNGMTFEIGINVIYRLFLCNRRKLYSYLYLDGVPVRLQEFLHVKPGKGAAFVRTKIKNLVNGSVQEKTFRAGESIVPADVSKTDMQYTYTNGDLICFMNMETFEEQVVDKKKISNVDLLTEGTA